MHIKYPNIIGLHKEDAEGILNGICVIEEKIDGANTSIWVEDGQLKLGTRNRELDRNESFNGFRGYVGDHIGISELLRDYPNYRLFGEWLVKHSVGYNELNYKHFYLFDIFYDIEGVDENGYLIAKKLKQEEVMELADKYNIRHPVIFDILENPTKEDLEKYVGKSSLGAKHGEGIVIKNYNFTNKFGHKVYAKLVAEKFKEVNAVVFGNNRRGADNYNEQYITNKYVTLGRVQKIINKLEAEYGQLDKTYTKQVINRVYYDILKEEIWEIQKKFNIIKFKDLNKLITTKTARMFLDILEKDISVAFNK